MLILFKMNNDVWIIFDLTLQILKVNVSYVIRHKWMNDVFHKDIFIDINMWWKKKYIKNILYKKI